MTAKQVDASSLDTDSVHQTRVIAGGGPKVRRDLEKLAPWLKIVRLLRGPLFAIALAVLGGLTIVVAWLSWRGSEPRPARPHSHSTRIGCVLGCSDDCFCRLDIAL